MLLLILSRIIAILTLVFCTAFCIYAKDYNIADYGAVGDGTNLNTVAIQKCIDDCWKAGGWGCWINDSQYVTADKVKMYCNPGYPNSDGIHVNCSSDIMISSCIIHCSDDSIIVRANTNLLKEKRPCERVIVKGCVLSTKCRAVRICDETHDVIYK